MSHAPHVVLDQLIECTFEMMDGSVPRWEVGTVAACTTAKKEHGGLARNSPRGTAPLCSCSPFCSWWLILFEEKNKQQKPLTRSAVDARAHYWSAGLLSLIC